MLLQDLRDPEALKIRFRQVIDLRANVGRVFQNKMRKLHRKFYLIHDLFTAMDIILFPNFVVAHKEGIKGCQYSAFDSSIWLSGNN